MTASARARFVFFIALVTACFAALEIRLFHLQVIRHPAVAERAEGQHRSTEKVLAARGRVLARNGHVLAESIPAVDVYANSEWTHGRRDAIAAELENAFGDELLGVREKLETEGYRRILRKPAADDRLFSDLWQRKRAKKLPGIELERTWVRRYPEGSLAAHAVGYVDGDGKGCGGVEQAFDGELSGKHGLRRTERDAAQRPLVDSDCVDDVPEQGADLRLTLDVVLQYFAEEALDRAVEQHRPKWATAVVLDPLNGELLALASRPTFDPNHYGNYPLEQHANRAIAYHYTPGSSFKPFIMAAALDTAAVRLGERIDCSSFNFRGRTLHDVHPHDAPLTPAEIIAESSNIGIAKIALRLVASEEQPVPAQQAGFRRIHERLTDLGFGSKTDLLLPGEATGTLTDMQTWSRKYTLVSLAIGHEISVTPVQLAAAFAVFANSGAYHAPRVLDAVIDGDGIARSFPRAEPRQVFDPLTADQVREMLVGVVDDGTGTKAAVEGYSVAGKTSTAQWERDRSKYTSSFVGFAPAFDPRLLVVVVVDQPRGGSHFGGSVAAPAAGEILERGLAYLRVPQDRISVSAR